MERTSNPILHRLQQTLETNAPREEIAEALAAAEALGDALPELLGFRARERIEADRFLDRRRICFGIGCSLLLFVGAFSAVGLTTLDRLRAVTRDEATFQRLVDDRQWDEAQAFLDSLDEQTRSSQKFASGQQTIQEELERERLRKAEFDELVQQIRSDASGAVDDQMVSRLDELARTEEERAIAAEMAARADQQRLMREAGRVEGQIERFEELQQAVEHFFESESVALDNKARASRVDELRRQLQQFVSKNHLSNPDLTEAAKQTAALLVREDQRAQMRSDREGMIDAITASVGNADRFLRSIEQFAEAFPDDPLTAELQQLVANRTGIDAAEAWIAVLGHPAFTAPETADSKRSGEWIEMLDRAIKLEADHPLAENVLGWRADYEAIAKRAEMLTQIRQLYQSDLLGRMYLYPDIRRGWYYSDVSPQGDSPTAHVVEYFADLSLNRRTKNFGSSYHEQILPRVRLAGHSAYAAKAARTVSLMDEHDFTPGVFRLMNELRALDVDSDIDPIFKLDLMVHLLRIGVEGSVPLKVGFDDWRTSLESSNFPWDANWMSPGDSDPQVTEARGEARLLLQSVRNWDGRVKRMGESFRNFRKPRREPPKWIGWVARQDDRYVALLQSQDVDGLLFVLARNQTTGHTSLVEIGQLNNGSVPNGSVPNGSGRNIEDLAARVVGAPICVFPTTQSTVGRPTASTPADAS